MKKDQAQRILRNTYTFLDTLSMCMGAFCEKSQEINDLALSIKEHAEAIADVGEHIRINWEDDKPRRQVQVQVEDVGSEWINANFGN